MRFLSYILLIWLKQATPGSFFSDFLVVFSSLLLSLFVVLIIIITRSYAALRAADLDWIVRPGYSSDVYMSEKNHEKPT